MTPGARNLITDIAGLRVGNAATGDGRSGVTVLTADRPFTCGVHVMGGAPGTRETDLLAPGTLVEAVDALFLSGGSAHGLAAGDGVAAGLLAAGRGYPAGGHLVPIVPGAILFDLGGMDPAAKLPDYRALGAAALSDAADDFALGSVGAGSGATTASLRGGLGSASALLPDGTRVGALVAANPVGCAVDPASGRFWAAPYEIGGEFGARGAPGAAPPGLPATKLGPGTATTIAVVATDAALDKAGAMRLAMAAQDGMARALLPSHTPFDGDLVFGVATGEGAPADPPARMALGHAAALCLSRAIARAVFLAAPSGGVGLPSWGERFGSGQGAS